MAKQKTVISDIKADEICHNILSPSANAWNSYGIAWKIYMKRIALQSKLEWTNARLRQQEWPADTDDKSPVLHTI